MSPTDIEVRQLVVTGPARATLYEHFSHLFSGRHDVVVIEDRRRADRRRRRTAVDVERRTGQRRRRVPDWVVPPAPIGL